MEITVLLHKGGFCNAGITKRCLHKSTNVWYKDLFSRLLYDIDDISKKSNVVLSFSEWHWFFYDGKLVRTKSVSWCCCLQITRYVFVAAPNNYCGGLASRKQTSKLSERYTHTLNTKFDHLFFTTLRKASTASSPPPPPPPYLASILTGI
jgi:hypothetical protein